MAKFVFKLEPLLKHRVRLEEAQQRALAKLLREKLIIETQLRNQQQSISDDKSHMAQSLSGHVDVARIRQHAAHVHRATVHAQQAAFRLLELNHQIESARAKLNDAVRDRKAIEVLRERQHTKWLTEQKRREATQLDEAATQRYVRQQRKVAV
jgi:flagellar FliJ protein